MGRTPAWPRSSPVTGSTSRPATARHRRALKSRHEPARTCVACRQEAGKRDLIRVVRGPDGVAALDPTGRAPGRGAYLHASPECVEIARKKRALDRALGVVVQPEVWSELNR